MANMLFANNCTTTLASSLTSGATSMSVTSATGFPSPTGVQYFYCTLADAATQTTIEIVKVTSVSGTTFAITRAQDGTSATAFAAGAVVSLRLVRASLNDFPKLDETNTFNADQAISGQLTSSAGLATTGTFTATAPSDGLVMDYATGFGRFSAFAGDGFQWYNAGIANTKLMQLSSSGAITTATWNGNTVGVAYGGTGVTASSGANSVVLRDSNQNVFANNFIPNTTTTVASSTPINLTVASAQYQIVTGSVTSQTFNMPDATTLTVGDTYYFNNNITYSSVQINAHDGSTSLLALQAGGAAHLILLTNSTSNGTWDVHSYIPSTVSWGTATLNFNSSSSISGSVSWQGNVISATYGGTGEAGTLTGILYGNGTSAYTVATTAQLLSGIGTLPVANGGTGLTSLTAGYIPYGNGTGAFSSSSGLYFDGNNLGIGTTSPAQKLQLQSATSTTRLKIVSDLVSSLFYSGLEFARSGVSGGALIQSARNAAIGGVGLAFNITVDNSAEVSGTYTESMRLDSSGNLLVNTTSASPYQNNNSFVFVPSSGGAYEIVNHISGAASGSVYVGFGYNGGAIGSISQNGTTGVLYNLTSDYRLKNNATPLTGASEFIMALQPKTWDWWDGSGKGVGFIAHEFMEVAKYSGNGKKDEIDIEGKPIYQSIQPSSSEVMANLVALVQEQQIIIEQLKTKVGL